MQIVRDLDIEDVDIEDGNTSTTATKRGSYFVDERLEKVDGSLDGKDGIDDINNVTTYQLRVDVEDESDCNADIVQLIDATHTKHGEKIEDERDADEVAMDETL